MGRLNAGFFGGDINVGSKKSPCRAKHGRNAFSNSTIILALHLTITDEVA